MNAAQPNAVTGFLESINPANWLTFDSDKKQAFIRLAMKACEQRAWPEIHALCDTVGISVRTFNYHLHKDLAFKDAWNEVKERQKSIWAGELSYKAKTKMGTLANLAVLRYLETSSWVPEKSNQVTDSSGQNAMNFRFPNALDAELADNQPNTKPLLADTRSNGGPSDGKQVTQTLRPAIDGGNVLYSEPLSKSGTSSESE